MPIVLNQLTPANAGRPGYSIAKELARQTVAQFGAVRWAGVGIGGGSCCAALAVNPTFFPAANALVGFNPVAPPGVVAIPNFGAALQYGIVFGNSQLARGGLDLGPLGGHAERAALTAAAGVPVFTLPGNNAVLFVELTPCHACAIWLNGGGGGVANPYNGVINGTGAITLNVWWRWVYPGTGIHQMSNFHALGLAAQLADINGNW